uniref:PIH1 N-terminal domain-containing protein n=1 Tax=Eptatretus burgeri TaxID=7764 RepID=A0A8C4NIF4_EPTBU
MAPRKQLSTEQRVKIQTMRESEQSRQLYEAEVTALEKERGSDVTFLHLTPGFVLKTSDGEQKCFINVCSDDAVNRPTYKREQGPDGSWGMLYQFPNALVPPKKDKDNAGRRCVVYDVVFHSETLALAKDPRLQKLLVKTALDMVEKTFSAALDRHNLRRLEMPYKGVPGSTLLRRPLCTNAILPFNDPPLSLPSQASPPERQMSVQNRKTEEEAILNLKDVKILDSITGDTRPLEINSHNTEWRCPAPHDWFAVLCGEGFYEFSCVAVFSRIYGSKGPVTP